MGTFHHHTSELHGITVVVETGGPELWVGRCEDMDGEKIILLDADRHVDGESERSREEYLARAAQWGIWKQVDRVVIPLGQGVKVQRLADL